MRRILLVLLSFALFAPLAWADVRPESADLIALATPTHQQTGLIKATVADLPKRDLKCFCLTPDNRIVAGCAGGEGELRVFDDAGNYIESWSAPFELEAIHVRADGVIFLAGEGQLARLSADGQVELQQPAPHIAAMDQNLDKIREEVIEQNKRRGDVYTQQVEQFDTMLEQIDTRIDALKEQIAAFDEPAEGSEAKDGSRPAASGRTRLPKQVLERQLAMQERMKEQYEQVKSQYAEMAQREKPQELTDEQIERQVQQSLKYKRQASSISATDDEVFLATRAATGYGFEVWKMDADFVGGEKIISGLSGCCGQMDVKANGDGLFVAENSRHRVCRYDRDGKLICQWGHGARKGIDGFGSCCNPMNVAFGPDGVVYTAEDNTGRIKRYSPEGELLGLVGASKLVPGCKNVSIAVNSDGSRVYMLDITRGHIVRMEPYAPGEAPVPTPESLEKPQDSDDEEIDGEDVDVTEVDVFSFDSTDDKSKESPSPGGVFAKGVLKLLGY